jgi:hypothetical protein
MVERDFLITPQIGNAAADLSKLIFEILKPIDLQASTSLPGSIQE